MIRRLAILGLLGLTACPGFIEEPTPSTPGTGSVQGTLAPFQKSASEVLATEPLLLKRMGADNLSRAIASALASRGVLRTGHPTSHPLLEDPIIKGEVIVRFEEANLSPEAALARVRVSGYQAAHKGYISEHLHAFRFERTGLQAMGGTEGTSAVRALTSAEHTTLVQSLASAPGVRYAESNQRMVPFAVPNDPRYREQWHYPNMNLPAAWDITTGSDTLVMAVVDTGILPHPDLDSRVLPGIDLISDATSAGDGNGIDNDPTDMGGDTPTGSSFHGLHVAGTMGAISNNGTGVAGVTWKGKILPVRVLGKKGGSLSDIAAGMNWAAGGTVPGARTNTTPARVINLSLGGTGTAPQSLQDIVSAAASRGSIFVIAAGNENTNATDTFPCNMQNVICVGSVRFNGKRSSFSNYGPPVDVMAAGGQVSEDLNGDSFPDGVLSTLANASRQPDYERYNGTSMAAPHVAGIVGLMLAVSPDLSFSQVETILKETADTSSRCAEGCGAGLVNAQAAVLRAKGASDPNAPSKLSVTTTQMSFSGGGSQELTVRNIGGGTLLVNASVSGAQASAVSLSSRTLSIAAYKSVPLTVTVNPGALANGSYVATLSLTSSAGSAEVLVKFRVGATQDKDAVVAFLYEDAWGEYQLDEEDGVWLVSAASGYSYSVSIKPRTYYVLASIDDTGDGKFFEEGDRVGLWRDFTEMQSVNVKQSQMLSNISFSLVPYKVTQEPTASLVGGPCTSNANCGTNGLCATTGYPGGYCTQDCLSTNCPAGSQCYSNPEGTAAYCFATCTGAGAQGTCRSGYICYDDGTGTGTGACDTP
ncbi:S8 family peptidase [Archangium gephyra]|uniref:S8 family peptidase n=1 Tax=Archangium gephyra TaxID=48 RepID=UPI0035D4ABD3